MRDMPTFHGCALMLILMIAALFGMVFLIDVASEPAKPCPTMVAHSTTCLPFGCTKTYINEQGEDTGECR